MTQPHVPDLNEAPARTVSRRTFFNRTRLAVLAVAGAAVFGVGISTGAVTANEDDEKQKEKKKKSEPRDKDREEKEKSTSSNTKKKTKKTNGDTGKKNKKKKSDPVASSPYSKYVVDGKDQYGCTAFSSQAEAQAVLRLSPKDPNNLDSNGNGIACDGSEAFMDGVAAGLMSQPFDVTPVPRP
jgi:hypothetical protein